MPESTTPAALKATRREWIGLAVLAVPCLLYSMDLTVLVLAVPHLTADLAPSAVQLLWIMDIYGFLLAGFLITMGTLGDRIGRRRLLMIGAAAFGIGSILAAFSSTASMLIVSRALLGISAATLAPSTLSLLRNMFHDPAQRTFAIGIWIASFSAGGAIGPLIGGALLTQFWWGSVFLLNVPLMLVLLAVGPRLLPEFRDPDAGRIDLLSAVQSLSAVLAVIYGLKQIAAEGLSWIPALAIVAGVAIGAAFVSRQRQLADPLIDVRLFRSPIFSASVAANMLGAFIAFGSFFFIAQHLQSVLGMGPLEAGLWTAPSGLMFIAGSMLAPLVVHRFRPAYVMAGGFTLSGFGLGVLTQIGTDGNMVVLMTGYLLFCLGLAPVFTLTTDLIIGAAPPERAGAASGISETGAEFGGALGIAVQGSIVAALYRGFMADGVPQDIAAGDAEIARSTLGGAVAVAERVSGQVGADLLTAARMAFTQSFEVSAGLCAVSAIGGALLAVTLLRRIPGSQDGGGDVEGEPAVQQR